MKIESVWVQIRGPQGNDSGLVECGHYKMLEDGSLQMCTEDGKPIGKKVKLEHGDRPQRIAGRLTKERWAARTKENSFNRKLEYPVWRPA